MKTREKEKEAAGLPTLTVASIQSLTPDSENANRGTERGNKMIQESIERNGAGRSVVLDMYGNIIGGDKTARAAMAAGLKDVIIVQTTGEQLVAVQRMDLDLSEKGGKARELAFLDNRTAEVSLNWDLQMLVQSGEDGIDLSLGYNQEELDEVYASVTNDTGFLDTFIYPSGGDPPDTPPAQAQSHTGQSNATGSQSAPVASVQGAPPANAVPGEISANTPVDGYQPTDSRAPDRIETETITAAESQTVGESSAPVAAPPAPVKETVTWQFVMDPALRDELVRRANEIKAEQGLATHTHVLCHLLGVAYRD